MNYALLAQVAFSGAVAWSLICRARLMDANTRARVRWQHGALMAAAVFSPFAGELAHVLWGAGIALFLILERRSPAREPVQSDDAGYIHILPASFRGVPR